MNRQSTISASGLHLRYGGIKALTGVTLDVDEGITGLLGPNGAGKTTLLRILATALRPDAGTLQVFGADALTSQGRQSIRRHLGYLPQNPGFQPGFTAFDFVDYVAILKELTRRRNRHEQVRRVLQAVGLEEVRGKRIKALSGGMRQRVALAAALVGDPDFVVLDEPTVGLDPEQRLRFRELIADTSRGRSVVLSTHLTEDVATLCHRVIVLDGGAVRFAGTPADLAAIAAGRVWSSDAKAPNALAGWRTGMGTFRNIGQPPPGAQLLQPSLEDGYMLLVGPAIAEGAAA